MSIERNVIVSSDEVRTKFLPLLKKEGVNPKDADTILEVLIETELCGVSTHGIGMLPAHIERIRRGGYNLSPKIRIINEGPSFAVMDADNSVGMVSAVYAMNYAIEHAKKAGIYVVMCNHANTYSAAFYYTKMACEHKMIGISYCNTPAAMGVDYKGGKIVGTNPLSVAIPFTGDNRPFILDMSTSIVAKSKIGQALKNGEKIPEGWAVDSNGEITTDPQKALEGMVLPMAGPKGLGLAIAIDFLSGFLSGAGYLNKVGRFYDSSGECMNVGQTFIAICPEIIYGGNNYEQELDNYYKLLRDTTCESARGIRIPGDGKMKAKEENVKNGINLASIQFDRLNEYLEKAGLEKMQCVEQD